MASIKNALNFSRTGNLYREAVGQSKSHHHPGLDWMMPVSEVPHWQSASQECLLVGQTDRYRVGDMLMQHVLTRLIHFSKLRSAGLVASDYSKEGAYHVRPYGERALEMGGATLQLVHTGGEILSPKLVDAYVEVADEQEADKVESLTAISGEAELLKYVRRRTGQVDDFAYVLASEGEFLGASASFHAVGLSSPESLGGERLGRLLQILRSASFVGIRDQVGAEFLEQQGISVHRMPCALTVLPLVGGRPLREARDSAALEEVRSRFPNGWITAEVGDVQEKDFYRLSRALREVARAEGLGVVFVRAHQKRQDNAAGLRRWVDAFHEWGAMAFDSDHIWEIASLLLHSRLYCGSDLSCRVIAMAGGVARINVPTGRAEAASYCQLWEMDGLDVEFTAQGEWEEELRSALHVDLPRLAEHATALQKSYFEKFADYCASTGLSPRVAAQVEETEHQKTARNCHHLNDEWLNDAESRKRFRRLNRRNRAAGLKNRLKSMWSLQKPDRNLVGSSPTLVD